MVCECGSTGGEISGGIVSVSYTFTSENSVDGFNAEAGFLSGGLKVVANGGGIVAEV